MRSLLAAARRVAGLFTRRGKDAEFAAELESHLSLHIDDGIRAGLSPEAARRQALLRLGGVESVKESYRDRAGIPFIDAFSKDVGYAVRSLRKSPVVTGVAILSLALGIGANAAIFSLIEAVLLRSLPIQDPARLVSIYTVNPDDGENKDLLSRAMYDEIAQRQQSFSSMFGWDGGQLNTFEAEGHDFAGMLTTVTGDYFAALGVSPFLGRAIRSSDLAPDGGTPARVAMLGYRCWQNHFHADPEVVGKTIRLNDVPLTIVGVTPRNFSGLIVDGGEDVIVPANSGDRWRLTLGGYGRLKPGVSIGQARAELKAIWPAVQRAAEPENSTAAQRARFHARKIGLESAAQGHAYLRARLTKPLTVLMALVGIVLLIACANLAGLMLARAEARRHELAVRTALGAGQWRLARQVLTESALLALVGAAAGFLVAIWTSRLLLSTMWTTPVPLALDASPDARVLLFTAAVSLVTALLFGLAPAWRAMRSDPAHALRQNTRSVRGSGRHIGRVLVSAQVAFSMVVVLAAALFIRSLKNMRETDPGFRREGVLVMQLMAQPGRQATIHLASYYREMTDRVSRLPGVLSASFSVMGPVNRGETKEPVAAENSTQAAEQAAGDVVGPGFFRMIGMRILAGREFEWSDTEHSAPVTVISQSLATRLFPDRDAVGQYLDWNPGANRKRLRIVGVVNSASLWRIQHRNPMAMYRPLLQSGPTGSYFDIRYAGNSASITPAAARVVEDMGHEYPLYIQL